MTRIRAEKHFLLKAKISGDCGKSSGPSGRGDEAHDEIRGSKDDTSGNKELESLCRGCHCSCSSDGTKHHCRNSTKSRTLSAVTEILKASAEAIEQLHIRIHIRMHIQIVVAAALKALSIVV